MTNALWGGRFTASLDEGFRRFNDSFAFDVELLNEELSASSAWAAALSQAGALSANESADIRKALEAIGNEPVSGDFEDVHSYVEAKLREKVGDLGGKLHTGRSRNDQVATDLRLYLKGAFKEARLLTLGLCDALAARALSEAETVMPGYTHMKQAEPVTFGHWCLAYTEMLLRDVARFDAALQRADECPLGSAALAGSPVAVDRFALAQSLGFARPTSNSLDAVAERDAAIDYLHGAAMLLGHLSRFGEDVIFFSSDEAGFVQLPDALATGSSRMPQKKNPDLLELVRGHAARAIGELTGLLALMKGLPLAYNKDLQLDKEPLFRMRATLRAAIPALTRLVRELTVDAATMRKAAESDLLVATQLADALAARGIPFRQAHEMVGKRFASDGAVAVSEITEADLAASTVDAALNRKDVHGGTAPARVRAAAAEAAKRIAELKTEGSL